MLGLGEYPSVSLADARSARDQARRLVDASVNPAQARRDDERERRAAADNTFKTVALEWIERMEGRWTAHHAADVRRSLEQEAFPAIGLRPVAEITPSEVIDCLRAIEKRGAIEVAHRTSQRIATVFRYAVNTERATFNPAADLRGVLKTRKVTHLKAMPRDDLPEFLRKLETYDGRAETRIGLRLLALTFVRTGELRGARWAEIDLDKAEWRIPAERMKMREEHVVPLSTQAIETLRELQTFTGRAPLLFPGRSNAYKPVSENTFLFALYRLGYHSRATGHGFRALASTTLNEQGWPPDVIERQLAHAERNKVRAAYNRAQYMAERREMMQAWADFLDAQRDSSNVVPLKRRA
jgi:integrase